MPILIKYKFIFMKTSKRNSHEKPIIRIVKQANFNNQFFGINYNEFKFRELFTLIPNSRQIKFFEYRTKMMRLVFLHINVILFILALILTVFNLQSFFACLCSLLFCLAFYYINNYISYPLLSVFGNFLLVFQLYYITMKIYLLQFHISTLIFTVFLSILNALKGNPLIYHFLFQALFVITQYIISKLFIIAYIFSFKDYLLSGLIQIFLTLLYMLFLRQCIHYFINLHTSTKSMYIYARLIENLPIKILIINEKLEILFTNNCCRKNIFHYDGYPEFHNLNQMLSNNEKRLLINALHRASKENNDIIVNVQMKIKLNENNSSSIPLIQLKVRKIEWECKSKCYVLICADITTKNKESEELVKTIQDMEIKDAKNDLNAIQNFKENGIDCSLIKKFMRNNLISKIERSLYLSKKIPIQKHSFNIIQLIFYIYDVFSFQAKDINIKYSIKIEDNFPVEVCGNFSCLSIILGCILEFITQDINYKTLESLCFLANIDEEKYVLKFVIKITQIKNDSLMLLRKLITFYQESIAKEIEIINLSSRSNFIIIAYKLINLVFEGDIQFSIMEENAIVTILIKIGREIDINNIITFPNSTGITKLNEMKNFDWEDYESRIIKYQRIRKIGSYESLSPDPSSKNFQFASFYTTNNGKNETTSSFEIKKKLEKLLIQEKINKKKSEIQEEAEMKFIHLRNKSFNDFNILKNPNESPEEQSNQINYFHLFEKNKNLFDSIIQLRPIEDKKRLFNEKLESIKEKEQENEPETNLKKAKRKQKFTLIEDEHYEYPLDHKVGYNIIEKQLYHNIPLYSNRNDPIIVNATKEINFSRNCLGFPKVKSLHCLNFSNLNNYEKINEHKGMKTQTEDNKTQKLLFPNEKANNSIANVFKFPTNLSSLKVNSFFSLKTAYEMCQDKKILVVEDNHFQRNILEKLLWKLGFQVDVSENGQKAISLCKAHLMKGEHYDIIFMDIFMPGIDGLETTREIRLIEKENHQNLRTFICGMSSYENKSISAKCLKFDLNTFIQKPITFNNLKGFLFSLFG